MLNLLFYSKIVPFILSKLPQIILNKLIFHHEPSDPPPTERKPISTSEKAM